MNCQRCSKDCAYLYGGLCYWCCRESTDRTRELAAMERIAAALESLVAQAPKVFDAVAGLDATVMNEAKEILEDMRNI